MIGMKRNKPQSTIESLIGTTTIIEGEIRAAHVVVNGTVEGPIFVSEFLELQPKARVCGDVHYKTLEIHLGATLDGKLEHTGAAEARPNNLKLAANNA